MQIIEATNPSQLDQIKELFREYYHFLASDHNLDINYQGIEEELSSLPGKFTAPFGRLLLALEEGHAVGCAAMRPLEEDICELKRMYVLPQYRGLGIGKALALELIQDAKEIGYVRMRLDTASFLTAARKLYESLGFQLIEPYNDVPEDIRQIALFMELSLE